MKRFVWLDVLKLLAMLAVIVGHTVSPLGTATEQFVRAIIYSVHMPLLFFLAGVTFKPSRTRQQFLTKAKSSARQLLLPAFLIVVIRALMNILLGQVEVSLPHYIVQRLMALFFSSGTPVHLFGRTVQPAGMVWFLVVLFWARLLLDWLYQVFSEKVITALMLISLLAGHVISKVVWLPLSLDIVFLILPFLFLAYRLATRGLFDNFGRRTLLSGVLLTLIWLAGTIYLYDVLTDKLYLELAARHYPLPWLSMSLAILGSIGLVQLAIYLSAILPFLSNLAILGQYNLYLFMIHAFDPYLSSLWQRSASNSLNSLFRLLVDLAILLVILGVIKIRRLRQR